MELIKKGKVWVVLDGKKEVYRGKSKPKLDEFKQEKKPAAKKKPASK